MQCKKIHEYNTSNTFSSYERKHMPPFVVLKHIKLSNLIRQSSIDACLILSQSLACGEGGREFCLLLWECCCHDHYIGWCITICSHDMRQEQVPPAHVALFPVPGPTRSYPVLCCSVPQYCQFMDGRQWWEFYLFLVAGRAQFLIET